jgi:hypothetical protein
VRGMISAPSNGLLLLTARDAIKYEYSGKSNRDSGTYVKTSWGHTEVRQHAEGHCELPATILFHTAPAPMQRHTRGAHTRCRQSSTWRRRRQCGQTC